jgi:pyruvate/2-oxoglutarate dehydrogenase complex dihydrolipoamide acyltransferase (E2) component
MSRSSVVGSVLASCLVFGVGMAAGQDKPAPAKPAAPAAPAAKPAAPAAPAAGAAKPAAPAAAAPAAAPMPAPTPAPELVEYMKDMVGSWKCETTFATGAFYPGSSEVKAAATVKISKDAALGGFFYKGEYKVAKSKTVPMAFNGIFYLGYESATKQITNVSVDNMGGISMGAGPLTGTMATWSGEGYMNGAKVKTRETMTKDGPKAVTHKFEVDMGKGFQLMGTDVCKK